MVYQSVNLRYEPQTYNESLGARIHQLSVLKAILNSLCVLLYRNNENLRPVALKTRMEVRTLSFPDIIF